MKDRKSIGKLISIIYRYSNIYFQKEFMEYNLGYGQISVLMYVAYKEAATLKSITKCLKLDKGTTSFLVSKLESNKYIFRKKNQSDKREYNIFITEKAKKIIPKIKQARKEWTELLLSDFSEEEKLMAFNFLERMKNNVEYLKKKTESNEKK